MPSYCSGSPCGLHWHCRESGDESPSSLLGLSDATPALYYSLVGIQTPHSAFADMDGVRGHFLIWC